MDTTTKSAISVAGSGSTLKILDQVNLSAAPTRYTSTVCLAADTTRLRPTQTNMSSCSTLDWGRVRSGGSVCISPMIRPFHPSITDESKIVI